MRLDALVRLAPLPLLALLACGEGPAAPDPIATAVASTAEAGSTTIIKEELFLVVGVPCANGGAGENVLVQGTFLRKIRSWTDPQGGSWTTLTTNPQDVQGVGLTSGARYVGAGITRETLNAQGVATSLQNSFLLVGRGEAEDLKFHQVLQVKTHGAGGAEVVVERSWLTCR